ncbi:hypothetical protein BLS_007400 [Venturia inaequalis]|uniref:General negative regulator of transcription subunit 1 n=1 Tax=Venturia inaequalis TaxID=5025 RepID=A0A8H3Z336_VENIN|nr:hypothetical protein BLS_007400 [Venturia inaequalis]RDI88649.1 hypothetical protein Vi05172_g1389 [Venturia inaequalis]
MSSWGSRGVAPISTAFPNNQHSQRRDTNNTFNQSPSRSTFSPVSNQQPPPSGTSRQSNSRATSVSSSSSPFSPSQGAQQQSGNQLLFSSRSNRTIPSSSSSLKGADVDIASPSSYTSAPFSQDNKGSTSIDIAQSNILLVRIDKEKDTKKREQLSRELIEVCSHGMEVFSNTFRKVVRQHASRIFGSDTASEPAQSYNYLEAEMLKIRQDPEQAKKIADALDTSEGEPFRDFDVSTFMERFKLDPVSKTMLALALKSTSKSDLKTKADAILSSNLQNLLMTIINSATPDSDDLPPTYLASLLDRLLQNPPRSWNEESQTNLNFAIRARYERMLRPVPSEVLSTLQLAELMGPANNLVRLVQRTGERATSSLEACNEMLRSAETRDINYTQVASALLFMVITQGGQAYSPAVFVAALRDHRAGKRLDWVDVMHAFDRPDLTVSKQQFLALYHALLPLAGEYENFDIQKLWGGEWQNLDTQLSFVVAFLSHNAEELDASEIPKLRQAYTLEDFEDAPEDVKEYAKQAVRHPLVSLDATTALFNMIFQSQDTYKHAISLGIPETVINPHTDYFVMATAAVPQPWGGLQDQAFKQLFMPFLQKRLLTGAGFVFYGLWKRDSTWLAHKLLHAYEMDPQNVTYIYEQAIEHDWLPALTQIYNSFGVDLVAYAHRAGGFDLKSWLQAAYEAMPNILPSHLCDFIEEKARIDQQSQKDPSLPTLSIPLAVGTVYTFLTFLEPHLSEELLIRLLRLCMQAYPRLINYGEGYDEVIDANGKDGNATSGMAETAMAEHFKKLYNRECDVRELVEALRQYKHSEDPGDQDLFACMIAGLFDEYACFSEYPPDALATTAVLFGSIINFNLLSSMALQAALSMVLEALTTASSKDDKMFKFGLQALMTFQARLSEWPSFCERLTALPDLADSEIYGIADDVVRKRVNGETNGDLVPAGLTNGHGDVGDLDVQSSAPFHSLAIDPPLRPDVYEEPEEEVQDRVIFAVNNLSERNIKEKFEDLKDAVKDEYHQWFAMHLVEDRAKSQPNYHKLFLDLLQLFNDSWLWEEVIRETIVAVVRMLNADLTMTETSERALLKNLGGWLGSLTLARDKPIRHRNISFVDLLIEANKTKRLMVVIPFTCKILASAKGSKTFSITNPWVMDILSVLKEFYSNFEIKLNLKFEIEVTCKALEVDLHSIEESTWIRDSQFTTYDEVFVPGSGEQAGLEGFTDLSLARINNQGMLRSNMGERFSPADMTNSLPDISDRLFYPPIPNVNQVTTEQIRQIFLQAATHAIQEIIFPVVERSVTIAGISSSQLVTKDFGTEPDGDRYRSAAHSMVQALAGSLALVTCREPLRMSMANNVRALARTLPGEGLPEGIILMFVNENIDIVCKVVEEAAEKQSVAIVEESLHEGIHMRQVHQSQHPDERFEYPSVHRYANFMPEPFRPSSGPGGLHPEQLSIYENFGASRVLPTHGTTASQDARQQMTDLPAFDPSLPNITTPAEQPAIPRQGSQPQRLQGIGNQMGGPQVNGYGEPASIDGMIAEVLHLAQEATEQTIDELPLTSPLLEGYKTLIAEIESLQIPVREKIVEQAAYQAVNFMLAETKTRLDTEIIVQLLSDLSGMSTSAGQSIWGYIRGIDDAQLLDPRTIIALLSHQLLTYARLDVILSKAMDVRKEEALELLTVVLDEILLHDSSVVLRAEFARTIDALCRWYSEDESIENSKELLERLQISATDDLALTSDLKQDHLEHIFEEWIQYVRTDVSPKILTAFVQQLHRREILKDSESRAVFLRACMTVAMTSWEREEQDEFGIYSNALLPVDSLARLVVYLVVYQGESEGAVKPTKPKFFEAMLSLLGLIQCHHFRDRAEEANSKIYFRLYSSILSEIEIASVALADDLDEIILVVGKFFIALQPRYFPAFSCSWLALIAHRVFMGMTLKMGAQRGGWDAYATLMEVLMAYTGDVIQARRPERPEIYFFRGVERTMLLIHHDFPDFVSENHLRLANRIPQTLPQLRNIITSAVPSAMGELPNPYYDVRADELHLVENIFSNPVVRGDIATPLEKAGIREIVDELLRSTSTSNEQHHSDINFIIDAVSDQGDNGELIQYLCVYIATQAIATDTTGGTPNEMFDSEGVHYNLILSLTRNTTPQSRYDFIEAIVNQLRFPSSHMYWFHHAVMEMMHPHHNHKSDQVALFVKEQIARVLLERLIVDRPYPWGVLITTIQLLRSTEHQFFDLPFVKDTSETWTMMPAIIGVQERKPYLAS